MSDGARFTVEQVKTIMDAYASERAHRPGPSMASVEETEELIALLPAAARTLLAAMQAAAASRSIPMDEVPFYAIALGIQFGMHLGKALEELKALEGGSDGGRSQV